ncbi:MAG TPA: ribonuclease HII [Candidatus Melainabacteria bacterium]|nr:ribonuclease HII [Candidatus Melainabacteria bacterium]
MESVELLNRLLEFDRSLIAAERKRPVQVLIGTDEVGRGCLAGPVVAAAVIMPSIDLQSELAQSLLLLNDSKQVKPKVREQLALVLQDACQFAVAEASASEVDELNVLYASLLAMRRAVRKLRVQSPALIAVDGNQKIRSLRMPQITIVDGDTFSASVAAASVIAKVYRDDLMVKLSRKHPAYSWESNKGYRSRSHWQAIHQHGMSKWHRRRFVERWLTMPYPLDRAAVLELDEECQDDITS